MPPNRTHSGPPKTSPIMSNVLYRAVLSALLAALSLPAHSYESDVHYGLTLWLSLKAGFSPWQARAIALGDYRIDSGSMSTLSMLPEYACVGKDAPTALAIQQRHYPSDSSVPSAPEKRAVEAGSVAARAMLVQTLRAAQGKELQYLGLFGAALHPLQDSWAHAGVPTVPTLGGESLCDDKLASSPPARGSGGPHSADLTFTSQVSTTAMAKATYEALTQFPSIQSERRVAASWSAIEPSVQQFANARTKTSKREWFVSQGVSDTAFLEGITLPDGPSPGSLDFDGRQLPPLEANTSTQYDAPVDARAFFDRLVRRWFGDEPLERVVADLTEGGRAAARAEQLTARLKLWRLRDHGAAADMAHLARPFSKRELAKVNLLSSRASDSIHVPPQKAFFPLVAIGPNPSPLLPFVVRTLPPVSGQMPRAIALARLKHAPHDTIMFVAEMNTKAWTLVDVIGIVDQ